MRDKKLVIGCIAIFAIIAIGAFYVYNFNTESTYSCESHADGSDISYSIHSSISNCYDVVISDNHGYGMKKEYYLYYDLAYRDNIKDVDQPIGSTKLDFEYYTSQLIAQLKNRGVDVVKVNADELKEKLTADIKSGASDKALIDVAGTFPSTVYTGKSDDLIIKWISNGGSLYWVGGLIGSTYATTDSIKDVTGYQELFFGCSCLNTGDTDKAYSEIVSNGYKNALALCGNSVLYGVDCSKVSDTLAVGFKESDYSSIALVKKDSGMICIVAGDYSNNQRSDLAQVIASHICYKSELVCHKSGSVTRGTVTEKVNIGSDSKDLSVYMYLGGYYLEYARCDIYKDMTKL